MFLKEKHIQSIPVNPPHLGPAKNWRINQSGGLTDFVLVIQRTKLEIGTRENWWINRKRRITQWRINRNPLYFYAHIDYRLFFFYIQMYLCIARLLSSVFSFKLHLIFSSEILFSSELSNFLI